MKTTINGTVYDPSKATLIAVYESGSAIKTHRYESLYKSKSGQYFLTKDRKDFFSLQVLSSKQARQWIALHENPHEAIGKFYPVPQDA